MEYEDNLIERLVGYMESIRLPFRCETDCLGQIV